MSKLPRVSGDAIIKYLVNKKGFQLIIKREGSSPACIKPEDVTKLVSQRMWGLPIN